MMPIAADYRNRALIGLRNGAFTGLIVMGFSTFSGLLVGWFVTQPPSSQKVEVQPEPILIGGLWGTVIGFLIGIGVVLNRTRELRNGGD